MNATATMAKITEETEKEFYYSNSLAEEKKKKCYVNDIEYSFAVVKGTESGKSIVKSYKKKYSDIELVHVGQIKNCSVEVKFNSK